MRYETRILEMEEAVAFMQNMRWFAGMGKITTKSIGNNYVSVRASVTAWSNWVSYVK